MSVSLKNPLNTNITYSMGYLEMEACITANMDVEKWNNPNPPPAGYPRRLKAQIVAWYSLHNLIKAHTQDTSVEKAKKDAEKERRKIGGRRTSSGRRRR